MWGPRGRGCAPGGGRALDPRGQVVWPPGEFLVPIILKYSTKNHISLSGRLENFYFRAFLLQDNSENRHKIIFLLYLI
mgnify:CR=1 FL=1